MIWNAKNGRVSMDGTEMCYASFGRGSEALVLIPGLSDGLATVAGKALLLAPPYRMFFGRYTVYMFSRKNGLTEGDSIRGMAADLAAAMRSLGIGRAKVMGVSQGGMIAQYLAIDHPEMVERLVLAVTAPRANAEIRDCVGRWITFAEQGDHRRLMIDTAETSYSERFLRRYRRIYPFIGLIGKPRDYRRFIVNARAILGFDAFGELPKIACPTLIVGGAEDRVVGAQAAHALHERIPGSSLFVYPGLGHAAYEEAGDFNERIFRFLESAQQ